ncbi:ABC transporter ATP-binding protein [Ferrovibrio sp.]|uniref:ABC transporter ATP-binding protein n=1 Tax=Ferrovibrio sp. TaxID=1917215 RepID=UPI002606C248|nr:ABC transporter ATP-binding protein [Ferrovibrio sp.]
MELVLQDVTRIVDGEIYLAQTSLVLTPGVVNVLLGPTLAGKTSLLRLMAGLDQPSTGKILVDGRDVTGQPVQKRNVAMVYQQFINYPTLSVYENIASPLRVARLERTEIDGRVRDAARLLKLEPMLQRLPAELSGGQQQRTAIARALVKRAELVLMDEPLANLDYKLREELRDELPRIFTASGSIFVYATTEPAEALLLGGRTIAMYQGQVAQHGPTAELYHRPANLTAARVFSDPPLNRAKATRSGNELILETGARLPLTPALRSLPEGDYTIGFRAQHLLLDRPRGDCLALTAIVAVSEITGSESYVHVDIGEQRWVALASGVRRYEPGQKIDIFLDPRRLFAFAADGRIAATADQALAA